MLTLVSVVCLLWSSLCLVSCLCFKARVDFPWEGVGRVCVFVRVSVCVCVCVSVALGLSQLFPSIWGHSTFGNFLICCFVKVLGWGWAIVSGVAVLPWS